MRNYAKFFAAIVNDTSVPGGFIVAMNFSYTLDEAQSVSDGYKQPPFDAPPYVIIPPFPIWFKMNKTNVGVFVNAAKSIMFVPSGSPLSVFNESPFYTLQDSPRATWDSDDKQFTNLGDESASGYESKPKSGGKSDFSGAPALLNAVAALPTLAAELTKAGRLREAGIVMYAYQQVLHQNMSITEALAYLAASGIL